MSVEDSAALAKTSSGRSWNRHLLKLACTERLLLTVKLHTGAVPVHAPPQLTTVLPAGFADQPVDASQ